MKNILILILSLFTVFGYSQTQMNPGASNSVANINNALTISATVSGTDTYSTTIIGATLTTNKAYSFTFINACTGSPTPSININDGSNNLGAITLKKYNSSGSLVNLTIGDIWNGDTKRFRYNGTNFVMEGGSSTGGTVTTVGVTTANGVSGSVANATTTPSITLTLGAITPSTVNGVTLSGSSTPTLSVTGTTTVSGTHSGSSSGTNTGDQTNISGNAATVTTNANLTVDVTSTGNATAIASGVIVDADVNASAAIAGTKIANTPAGGIAATTSQAAINEIDTEKANLASPTFTGTPSLPAGTTGITQSATDNSTKLATTAYSDAKLTTANTQTSNYTFALTDVGKIVRMNLTGTANTLTIPPNSSVAFPLYTWLYYEQVNTGITTLTQGAGVTATPPTGGSLITPNQGILCAAYKTGTDTWEVYNGVTIAGQALTKVDDTNVTLTLGGAPTTCLLGATSITVGWTSTLGVLRGGTGTGTQFTDGSVVFGGLAGVYSQDNANFFWDRTNHRLGLGTATPTSRLELSAGSTSANSAPLELNTGARETTPRAGLIQYTTPQLFFTNGGLIDQEIQLVQQSRVSTQFDATSNTTLANVTGLTSSLAAGKIYRFSAYLYTTSNSSGGVKFAIAGTATATSIIYEAITRDATTTAAQTRATALATTVGGATAVTNAYVTITGLIVCNAAGTLTVQFAQNASNGTASSVLVGSNFEVNEMP